MSQPILTSRHQSKTIVNFGIYEQMSYNNIFSQYLRFHFERVHDLHAEPILVDGVLEAFCQCPALRRFTNLPSRLEEQRILLNHTLCQFTLSLCGRYILGVSPRQHKWSRGVNPNNIPFVEIESEPQNPRRLFRQMILKFPRSREWKLQKFRFLLASLEFDPTYKLYRACIRGDTPGNGFTFQYKRNGKISRCMFNDSWFKFGTFPMKLL